jgi:hypothetical protein
MCFKFIYENPHVISQNGLDYLELSIISEDSPEKKGMLSIIKLISENERPLTAGKQN